MSTDSDVIEGVPLDIPGDELADLLEDVSDYHAERRDKYEDQLERQRQLDADEQSDFTVSGQDPVEQLEGKVEKHANKAAMRSLQAEYVNPSKVYRLKKRTIKDLGINNVI